MNHVVSPSRVLSKSVESGHKCDDHDGQHDGICSIKGIFPDQVTKHQERNRKARAQQSDSVPLKIVNAQKYLLFVGDNTRENSRFVAEKVSLLWARMSDAYHFVRSQPEVYLLIHHRLFASANSLRGEVPQT